MTVVEINSVSYGSTGNIAKGIIDKLAEDGHKAYLFVPRGRHNGYVSNDARVKLFGTLFAEDFHIVMGKLTGLGGLFSVFSTLSLVAKIKKLRPSVIHLHNLHKCYINIPILFSYLKRSNLPVVWTFHDCWPFTGHCPHFSYEKCCKWLDGCSHCVKYKEYPSCVFDDSKLQYKLKKKYFTALQNLHIVTPSHWLSDLVSKSFFKNAEVQTIHNGVDLSVFKPVKNNSVRKDYGISDGKFIVLCVAMSWSDKKGLDVVTELSKALPHEKYQIILVGMADASLPPEIIAVEKTKNQSELAALYTAADVFVNPTREEVLGLVNIESLACGTPGVAFASGGVPECYDETCGITVECDNVDALKQKIVYVCEEKPYSVKACTEKAKAFDKNIKYKDYVELYERIDTART